MKKDTGFTIIELIIVICILALLSMLIFSSIGGVRRKSGDTTIKSNLSSVRAEATSYFSLNNNYGTATLAAATTVAGCSTANTFFSSSANPSAYGSIVDAESASDPSSTWVATCAIGKLSTEANATSWAVAVPLKAQNIVSGTSGVDYWCVDSAGNVNTYDTASLGGGAATIAKCS